MALSQAQWYEKIRSWVPAWWFEEEGNNVAVFKAIAKVLERVELDLEAHQGETFIAQAEAQFLDAHGEERSVDRASGELDAVYSGRIRNMISVANAPAIKSLVDALLEVGSCTIREHAFDSIFAGRDCFLNRREVFTSIFYDAFTIVVSNQGVGAEIDAMMESLARAVDEAKALGTLYRVAETVT